jgi:hypothetical protein
MQRRDRGTFDTRKGARVLLLNEGNTRKNCRIMGVQGKKDYKDYIVYL